jgi:hypothetical protein
MATRGFGATALTRLEEAGFRHYHDYLRSDHWRGVNRRYRESRRFPQCCLACGGPDFQLHHRTYERLGREPLTDLLPLCRDCHFLVHGAGDDWHILPAQTHAILRRLFRWTKGQTKRKFAPWRLPGRPNGFYLTPGKVKRRRRTPIPIRRETP